MFDSLLGTCNAFISGVTASPAAMPLSLFLGGMGGSVVHCTTMCGASAISAVGHKSCASSCSRTINSQAATNFHIGRMASYTILALLTYNLFHLGFAWSPLRQFMSVFMLFFAGVIFLSLSVPALSALFPWAASIKLPLPQSLKTFLYARAAKAGSPLARGFFLGFMPCGLLFSALLVSASAPTLGTSLLSILAFACGTMPALIALQYFGNYAGGKMQTKFPKQWGHVRHSLLALNGIFLVTLGVYLARNGF